MQGCVRDRHVILTLLTIVLLFIPILLVTKAITLAEFAIVESIVWVLYLLNVFYSNTYQYLRNISTTESVVDYMNRMYRTKPIVRWFIQCYHNETRTRLVYSPGPNGSTMYRTETYQQRVNTHSARGKLIVLTWTDVSIPLDRKRMGTFAMTKVSVQKKWSGDEGTEQQKRAFILENHKDVLYDFHETLELPGYCTKLLGFVDLDKVPLLAHWKWYVFSHLTIVLGVPYRMWFSSKSHKIETTIEKKIFTTS